jgi:hypothetical protein
MKMQRYLNSSALGARATFAPETDAGTATKSIVNPKYRGLKKDDFITHLIARHATKMKDKVTKTKVEGSDEEVETVTKVADGVDVDGLFKLAGANNLDVEKFHSQTDSHGFPGRFRMTVGNMLRAAARNRHGVYEPIGDELTWIEASPEWLSESKPIAPEFPTHNRDGSKIKKVKEPKESTEAPVDGEAAAE